MSIILHFIVWILKNLASSLTSFSTVWPMMVVLGLLRISLNNWAIPSYLKF
jgi:hypothetical protein